MAKNNVLDFAMPKTTNSEAENSTAGPVGGVNRRNVRPRMNIKPTRVNQEERNDGQNYN